jgi:drug/metabolite transporter (DMT)-like permease
MYAFALVLIAALLFGVSTPLSKGLLAHWSPQQLAGLLYLGAALGTSLPMALNRKALLAIRLNRANALRLCGAILFGGILGPVFLLQGLRAASAASVSLWLNLEMVATAALGALLFKDHLGRLGFLGAACVLAAGIFLSWGEGAAGLQAGMFLGLACLCWGIDNNLTSLIDGLLPVQSTFFKGLFAGGCNLALGLWLAPHAGPWAAAFPALLLGAFSYGASIVLYVGAAQNLGATRSQMVFASAPLFGLLVAFVWLREPLTAYHAAALVLQAMGIFLLFRDRHSHVHTHEATEHTHSHRHDDGHHGHVHGGEPADLRHSHPHSHEPMTHAHPHWPDIHHRHGHGKAS